MAFKKGVSGNPAGRPKIDLPTAPDLRKAIAQNMPDIINMLVEKAKDGDVAAAKVLLDRVLPPLKPQDEPVKLEILDNDNVSKIGNRFFSMMAAGEITPGAAIEAMGALIELSKVSELQRDLNYEAAMRRRIADTANGTEQQW